MTVKNTEDLNKEIPKEIIKEKKSKALTILLVISLIIICSVVIYILVGNLRNKKLEQQSKNELERFDREVPTISLTEYEQKEKEKEKQKNKDKNKNTKKEKRTTGYYSSYDNSFTYHTIGRIRIPKTSISYPIYSSPGEHALETGIGLIYTENGLNEKGNTVLQGHNWRNWMFFSRNHLLKKGDRIYIKDERGVELEYIVYSKKIYKPEDVSYIQKETKGKKEIALVTCAVAATKRLVVCARVK